MKLTVRCREFKPLTRNTLRGFATVHIAEMCLAVHDVAVHTKNGKRWAALPAKPQIRDGALVKNGDGKVQYVPIMHFDTREVADAFSAAVVRAVTELDPEAFDEETVTS